VWLELKAARAIERSHESQLLNYLRGSEIEVGLLLNFGLRPQFRRLVFANERKKPAVDFAEYPDKADYGQFATEFSKKESA
jgi:PD-(D/E)XK nuclease superfamily